ncbi:MAG: hypothetical protein FWC43_03005 [Planctomycetaceae bacterium]|nr:hypothetical protein [Planctomycetaceae bacterium]
MCESCNGGDFDRRDFLKISGTVAAFGGFLATTALAQNADEAVNVPPLEKTKTKMAVLFLYPPADVVNDGRLEDFWAADHWFTYPGNQFEPEMNQQKYTKKIVEFAKTYDIDLDFQGVLYTKAALAEFVAKTKAAPPDTLLVVNFWNTFSAWVLEMSQQLAPLPMIVYHPVGSNHQLPPKGLMESPDMVYIHSLENWETLENAMAAANAKKRMSQSRLLRVTGVKERTTGFDKNLGIEIVSIPAEEYNLLFDSIQTDDALIRDAMAFKAKATAVIDVEDKYFVEGFRSRKAVLEIMKRYGADGITIRCLMLKERKPCIGFSLNNSALVPCACEDFPDSAMSLMIGAQLFRRGGFMHNPEFDIDRNQYYGSHCTCALELHGPGKGEMPFRVRPFTHQLPKTAALDVQITPGERVFLMKYIPSQNRMFAYTGTMVGSPEINTAGGCATRFVMDIDKIDDVCTTYQGPHPILYCGTAMEARRIKAFAKLARLEFVGNV